MICQECDSTRVAEISVKASDRCYIDIGGDDVVVCAHEGYVPHDMNIGGGDYLSVDICLDCGLAQGEWPLPFCEMEEDDG